MAQKGKWHPFTLVCLFSLALVSLTASLDAEPGRSLEVQSRVVFAGQTCAAVVSLEAQGNENGIGFSLAFDPTVLTYTGTSVGVDASSAIMNVNANQAANGKLGNILVLPTY